MATKQRTPSPNRTASTPQLNHNGNRRLERERVTDIQRARMLAAMTDVACERGAANVTVAQVVERAGVSRRTFYELFEDRDDCFLIAFEEAITRASEYVLDAYDPAAKWVERIRAGLTGLLAFLDDDPSMGRLLVVESLAAGPKARRRRRQALEPLIDAVQQGAGQTRTATSSPPLLIAEGVVGGVLAVLHARLCESESVGSMLDLAGSLMGMIVLPYLGAGAARREMQRPAPKAAARKNLTSHAASLNQLQMRLTYRTMCVLSALAANPGSSNRKVADVSGVSDQGQMSKLLSRLQQLGLIENASAGSAARGEPNAWTLTSRGWRIQSAFAQQHGG